jgi:hypothetical protein
MEPMKDLIPYAIVSIVCLALGAMLMKGCEKTPEPITSYDTLRITKTDTLKILSPPRISYRDRVEVVMRDTPRDSCCAILERCYLEQFFLSNLEAEIEKTVDGGSVIASWSTPAYLESGNGFQIEARFNPLPPVVIEKEHTVSFFDRFGYGLTGTAGINTQGKADAVVGVGFFFSLNGVF